MGSHCLGHHRRDISTGSPGQGDVALRGQQLAVELRYWLCHTIPRQFRRWQCEPWIKGLLHLGKYLCMLLYLHVLFHP